MRKVLLLSQIMMFWCAITCVAQQNLFTWVDGNVVANSNYIVYEERQLSPSMISGIAKTSHTLHSYQVSSLNNEYEDVPLIFIKPSSDASFNCEIVLERVSIVSSEARVISCCVKSISEVKLEPASLIVDLAVDKVRYATSILSIISLVYSESSNPSKAS